MRQTLMPSPGARHSIKKAKAEIAAGRNWRAKEILQGSISATHAALEPEVLEAYGALLDSMGDRFEAGKYLFLSGVRSDEYQEPIELFLDRTRRSHVNDLIAQFPAQIRRRGLGNLPQTVRDELANRGATLEELSRRRAIEAESSSETFKDRLIVGAIISGMVAFVASAFVGCGTIARWIL